MGRLARVGFAVVERLQACERRWIRPLCQRLRPTRAVRARRRRPDPAAEELVVALIRARLRSNGTAESIPLPDDSDLGSLVRTLLAVPASRPASRDEASAAETRRKAA